MAAPYSPRVSALACMAVLLAAAVAACSTQSGEAPATVASSGAAPDGIMQLGNGWTELAPGGATACSDGSPYRFFARKGDPAKLLVYLQGGGACWYRENCDPDMQPTYTRVIDAAFTPWEFGIFNQSNTDNPFADYSVVFAPYCTGDVHLGAADTVYPPAKAGQEPLTIRHRGRANMQAVLDWTTANVTDPTTVFVTGSSAGAIPSPFYASLIAEAYPSARIAQLGDGAGGYRRMNSSDARPDQQWGTFNYITEERGFESLSKEDFNYEKLYIAAAKANPDILFAEYDAAEDAVQKRFLALGGIENISLLDALNANHADIKAAVPNFRSIIVGGDSHTVLQRPEFYNYAAEGVSVRDWVAALSNFLPVADVSCVDCNKVAFAGPALPEAMQTLWDSWEDRETQYVEPFQIFDNVYYVGIDWVAAYVIETSEGLILIDSLYGSWVRPLVNNIAKLGLNPADVKYVINTHGHFDHAGGSRFFQNAYGARIVMAEEDWQLAETKPELPAFYMPVPHRDIVAEDGDLITLGDTTIELFKTPGHTEGVLTLRYQVRDGDQTYTAITLGGVGLNFSGTERTQQYLDSYARLQSMQEGVSVSLPNHAAMGDVFERAAELARRQSGDAHPFVDADGYRTALATFVTNAQGKLADEKAGRATDPLEALTKAVQSGD